VAEGTAASFGATAKSTSACNFAPLVNDPEQAEFAAPSAAELVGADKVDRNPPLIMASEDFSFMLEQVPGCYINIGNGLDRRRLRGAQPRLRLQRPGAAAGCGVLRAAGGDAAGALAMLMAG
jgi:metal-dependent amidase/aminoacylase/carboxypeptidase family protein